MTEHATMRDKAVTLARQGFRVFPVVPGTKKPAVPPSMPTPPKGKYHQHIPSRDPDAVWKMWTDWAGESLNYDIGINTEGLLVLDLDQKLNRNGVASFHNELLKQHPGLTTATVAAATPSGGYHYFYKLPADVDPTTVMFGSDRLGVGIDHRSYNSLVVGAGTVRGDRDYHWLPHHSPDETVIKEAPRSLVELCQRAPRDPHTPTVMPNFETDQPDAIAWFRQYAMNEAPEATEDAGGRTDTIAVLRRAGDIGLTAATAVEVLCEPGGWNETKAFPPWDSDDLLDLAESLEPSRDRPIGCDSAVAQFDCVEIEAKAEAATGDAPKPRLFYRRYNQARERMLNFSDPLIKKYLGKGEMSVLYGDSNTGKTFVALDMCFHIAARPTWNGQKVNNGLVVYVAAEAGESINARFEALHRHYMPESEPPMAVVPCLVDLHNPNADLKPLLALLKEISESYGMPIVMVVLDTLARVIGAGDENTAQDMGKLVGSIDRIKVETGAHVMVVHHSGKNKTNGARGSSALRAATDTEIEVEGGRLIIKKQRNEEMARPVQFKLRTVHLGTDADGDSVTSCVIELGASVDFEPQLTAEQQEWIDDLIDYTGPRGLEVFTYKDMQAAWSQPEREDAAKSDVGRIVPIRTVRNHAAILLECGHLELVSNPDDKTRTYKHAAMRP